MIDGTPNKEGKKMMIVRLLSSFPVLLVVPG